MKLDSKGKDTAALKELEVKYYNDKSCKDKKTSKFQKSAPDYAKKFEKILKLELEVNVCVPHPFAYGKFTMMKPKAVASPMEVLAVVAILCACCCCCVLAWCFCGKSGSDHHEEHYEEHHVVEEHHSRSRSRSKSKSRSRSRSRSRSKSHHSEERSRSRSHHSNSD